MSTQSFLGCGHQLEAIAARLPPGSVSSSRGGGCSSKPAHGSDASGGQTSPSAELSIGAILRLILDERWENPKWADPPPVQSEAAIEVSVALEVRRALSVNRPQRCISLLEHTRLPLALAPRAGGSRIATPFSTCRSCNET